MKHLFLPKNSVVFDYESQGDLFYMVIKGKVSCKVPFYKQLILLSDDEKEVFKHEFKDDIMNFYEASEINKQYGLDEKMSSKSSNFKRNLQQSVLNDSKIDFKKL